MNQLIGPLIVLISTAIYALLPVLTKKASQTFPPFMVMSISMFSLFFASTILMLIFEKGHASKLASNSNLIFFLLGIELLNTLSYWLLIQGFKYMPYWQQSMFSLLIPILSGVFAYFVLGEAVSSKLFIGLIFMSIGLFIALK